MHQGMTLCLAPPWKGKPSKQNTHFEMGKNWRKNWPWIFYVLGNGASKNIEPFAPQPTKLMFVLTFRQPFGHQSKASIYSNVTLNAKQ
jgi:hypothetical protein